MDKLAGGMIGMPVVTLDTGVTIAHVEDMIVDPSRRQVLALVVQGRSLGRGARAIPFGRIAANGPDAILVPTEKVWLELDRDPVLRALNNDNKVQGANVLTDTGRKVGKVTDMLVDDHTGEVKSYLVKSDVGSEPATVPSEGIVNLGRDVLYVTAAAAEGIGSTSAREGDLAAGDIPNLGTARAAEEVAPDKQTILPLALPAGFTNLNDLLGGTNLNTRLLFGILIIVLGILILVYPSLMPLIAGLSLIVLGLWIALQNAPNGNRP